MPNITANHAITYTQARTKGKISRFIFSLEFSNQLYKRFNFGFSFGLFQNRIVLIQVLFERSPPPAKDSCQGYVCLPSFMTSQVVQWTIISKGVQGQFIKLTLYIKEMSVENINHKSYRACNPINLNFSLYLFINQKSVNTFLFTVTAKSTKITAAQLAQLGECQSAEREVAGSNPSRTNTQGL